MSTHADQPLEKPYSAAYISNALRLFANGLEGRREGQLLDVGPVCGDNITFFAPRVKRLYVCDMFLRVAQDLRKGLPPSLVWRHLDYLPQSFDGILLWELVDHLDDVRAGRLVELCHAMVRPRGLLMVIVQREQAASAVVNSFAIGEDFRLSMRPQPHLELPLHCRQTREVLTILSPFTPLKSFIYHNGLREFVFQRH